MHSDWSKFQYCNNPFSPSRFITNEVKIGNIPLGGNNPIRIQSMANTLTSDTAKSVEQAKHIFDAGAEYVRFTASSSKEAENLKCIREELSKAGYTKPLIADVHFNPIAAEIAAQYVEKVRINPGNFIDKKKFEHIEYTDQDYNIELGRLEESFVRFLNICKKHNTAIRIGTNHGSLSDRIMSRFGDSTHGMVEATMEFLRIAKKTDFENLVVSLKSSNTRVMVQAYRLMVNQMKMENMNFPLHLGVTEAGEGEDGRIKSAVGIGSLLLDGIGDTIRVSLTEAPEKEIPVAQNLLDVISIKNKPESALFDFSYIDSPFEFRKRETSTIGNIGGNNVPRVIIDAQEQNPLNISDFGILHKNGQFYKTTSTVDYILTNKIIESISEHSNFIIPIEKWNSIYNSKENVFPLHSVDNFSEININKKSFLLIKENDFTSIHLENIPENQVLILQIENNKVGTIRSIISKLNGLNIRNPLIINFKYALNDFEQFQLKAAAETGALFIDGLLNGLLIQNNSFSPSIIRNLSFNILQATRSRIVKTEYISCPSCGRTHFDIEKVTAEIRKKTNHLTGLKIGIMGCIVNGPGEMADADYGYVGTAKGEITIYKQKESNEQSC
jgi:(E)-4-hydroxy-3-methylbut-2-enyl-diphosphate synthase